MNITRWMMACALATLAVVQEKSAVAGPSRCFDFAVPTVEKLFVKDKVQRLVIWVENAGLEAEQAAVSLADEAMRRELFVVTITPTGLGSDGVGQGRAAGLCTDNEAQMVATVRFLTGSKPGLASVDFEDATGQKLGSVVSWKSDEPSCQAGLVVSAPQADVTRQPTTWYGWQLMLADAASLTLVVTSPSSSRVPFLLAYALVPPALHLANGQPGEVGRSILLRAIPFGVAMTAEVLTIACRHGNEHPETCGSTVVAFLVSAVMVSILDDFLLAQKPLPVAPSTPSSAVGRAPGLALGVGVVPLRKGAGIGVSGRF